MTNLETKFNAFTLAGGRRSPLLYGDQHLVKRGFTLAEVLITLGIIGVVAAVTMPTLIKNYQKKQTVVQLKKAYSELSQALSMAQKDLGMMEDWDFANFPTSADRAQYFYDNVLKPNLKIVEYCAPSSNDCWTDDSFTLTGTKYTNLINGQGGRNSFITASGYSVYYWVHGGGGGGWLFVDLNGKKNPNILGKDIFVLDFQFKSYSVKSSGFLPKGLLYTAGIPSRESLISGNYNSDIIPESDARVLGGCSLTSENSVGVTCAALIMLDGWDIKDDYPW